jgi:hypothetical protein
VRRNAAMFVFSATAIQISGVNTLSMSSVTIDCFTPRESHKTFRRCPAVRFGRKDAQKTADKKGSQVWAAFLGLLRPSLLLAHRRFLSTT